MARPTARNQRQDALALGRLCWFGTVGAATFGCGALALLLPGCPPRELLPPTLPEPRDTAGPDAGDAAAEPNPARGPAGEPSDTRSPRPSSAASPIAGLCAQADGALDAVAAGVAARLLAGGASPDPAELAFELRARGAPYVWPKAWTISGTGFEADDLKQRAQRWLGANKVVGRTVCGVGGAEQSGREAQALVFVDALAHLRPVPLRVRSGQWVTVEAELLVPAGAAKVVVLGPRGAPQNVLTSLHEGVVKARFRPSAPGIWLAQVVATVATGPRPVAEARVHADVEPSTRFQAEPAPGEDAASGGSEADSLFAMVNAARRTEGLRALSRSRELDVVARAHAEAMRDAGVLGHDVGHGTVEHRLEERGLGGLKAFGENVARALGPERAHRAIWASPSHRGNLLEPRYDAVGIGVAQSPTGLWVCEVFAER